MRNHHSPLRYPGGKSLLSPYIAEVIRLNFNNDVDYVEPFAGGAGIALYLLEKELVRNIHLNDLNYPLFCFWHSVVFDTDLLINKIKRGRVTIHAWKRHKNLIETYDQCDPVDLGYSFLFLNRTNRSGIINGGVIGGLHQSGDWKLSARFYKNTLIDRIESIAEKRDRIFLHNEDACFFLSKSLSAIPKKSFIYIDPPYYKKGQRLYDNYYEHEDHKTISEVIGKINHKWITSYDNSAEIRELYRQYRKVEYTLRYSAARSTLGSELVIFSDDLKLPRPRKPRLLSAA